MKIDFPSSTNAKFKHEYLWLQVIRGVLLWTCYLGFSVVNAQQIPNAGTLQRDAEQGFKLIPTPKLAPLEAPMQKATSSQTGELTVLVKGFKYSGNTLISDADLNRALSSYINQSLTFEELKNLTQELVLVYKKEGWMVRAYLPKQEIDAGIVEIQIIEAVFGQARLDAAESKRIKDTVLLEMVASMNPKGEAIRIRQIDRALLLLNDLPGVSVSGSLVAGQSTGETDLSLQVVDTQFLNASVTFDNAGAISTGASRVLLSANLNSPANYGDLLTANVLKTQGSNYGRISYLFPVNGDGLRAGLHSSALNYQLIGNFSALQASGTAFTTGLDLTYPIIRSQKYNLNWSNAWDHKWFSNQANANLTSQYEIYVLTSFLNGNEVDEIWRGGSYSYSLGITKGVVNLTDSPNQMADAQGAQVGNNYTKFNFTVGRQQSLNENLNLILSFNSQKSNNNLDSSEKIYLGGVSGVRAYPSNEGGGSEGQTFSAELRHRFDNAWQIAAFYDYGRAKIYQNNLDINAMPLTAMNTVALKGVGLSLGWQDVNGLDLKLTLAKRILSNPLANVNTGADSDGTLRINRVWLSATMPY